MRIARCDTWQGFGDGLIKCFFGSSLGCAKQLFEFCPGLFDGVQIRRIGRQVKHLRAGFFDPFSNCWCFMRAQVGGEQAPEAGCLKMARMMMISMWKEASRSMRRGVKQKSTDASYFGHGYLKATKPLLREFASKGGPSETTIHSTTSVRTAPTCRN